MEAVVGKLAEGGSLAGVHHVEDYSHMVGLSRLEGVALRGSSAGLHPCLADVCA